jgi:hypothetical protein
MIVLQFYKVINFAPAFHVPQVLDTYKKSNPLGFSYAEVHGSHHVHLNSAEVVWTPIQAFLQQHPRDRFYKTPVSAEKFSD